MGVCSRNISRPSDVRQGDNVAASVQFLEGLPPKIWEGQKRAKFGAISDNFRLLLRISPEGIDMSKIGKVVDQQRSPPPSDVGRKKRW